MNVEEEVERLKVEIQRLGKIQTDGSYKVNKRKKAYFLSLKVESCFDFYEDLFVVI